MLVNKKKSNNEENLMIFHLSLTNGMSEKGNRENKARERENSMESLRSEGKKKYMCVYANGYVMF